jgi:hypothetical protein
MFGRGRDVKEAATRADVIKLFPATACSVWQDALYLACNIRLTEFATSKVSYKG